MTLENASAVSTPATKDVTLAQVEQGDLKRVAKMLSSAFDNKPNPLVKWYSVWNYESQLQERIVRLVNMGKKHIMLVASKDSASAVGFIEVGMLPLPTSTERRKGTASVAEIEEFEGAIGASPDDDDRLPTIGNLVVGDEWKKQGVATSMLREAERQAVEWGSPAIICAVDPNNLPAVSLYLKTGFKHIYSAKTTVQINVLQSQQDLSIMAKIV
jgi:ribosomal protein S18 acetylase RimI-like enzyme